MVAADFENLAALEVKFCHRTCNGRFLFVLPSFILTQTYAAIINVISCELVCLPGLNSTRRPFVFAGSNRLARASRTLGGKGSPLRIRRARASRAWISSVSGRVHSPPPLPRKRAGSGVRPSHTTVRIPTFDPSEHKCHPRKSSYSRRRSRGRSSPPPLGEGQDFGRGFAAQDRAGAFGGST